MNHHNFLKKFSIQISLIISVYVFPQNQRFIYEYKYIPDSTNSQETKSEIMLLDITPKFSKFYSAETFKSDSISKSIVDKQISATGAVDDTPKPSSGNKSSIKYTIIKDYSKNNLFFINRIGRYKYNVKDNRTIKWIILPEKDVVNTYIVQKATAEFGGRKWEAWFTSDLPFQDGPYKFKGLPGIILKIEDSTKSHSFTFVGLKNLTENELKNISPNGNFVFDFGENLDLDFNRYKKLYLESRSNPIKSLQQTLKDLDQVNVNGVMVDKNKYLREREIKLRETIKKDNNIIEIDMIK